MKYFGYYKKPKYESYNSELANSGKPYQHNGIWYNVYDNITEKDLPPKDSKEYERLNNSGFKLSAVEALRLQHFMKDHKNCRVREDGFPKYGAIGGGTVVSFMGTGLGPIIHVTCETCSKTVDITDNSCW